MSPDKVKNFCCLVPESIIKKDNNTGIYTGIFTKMCTGIFTKITDKSFFSVLYSYENKIL